MSLTVLLGGASAGKSRLAVRLAHARGGPVVLIATAEARDEEMAERIRRHQQQRPSEWVTVEEPLELETALASIPDDAVAVVDCLTLWVSNLMERGLSTDEISDRAAKAAFLAASRPAETIAVTNEVGSGIVPSNPIARQYRHALGAVNAAWTEAADRSALVVAGRVVPLLSADSLQDG